MAQEHAIRIIAGRWRGRKLTFPDCVGLRPTPNRIRETLFNWLQQDIQGARCLDLFAGSGALGFEALSRGADYVLFVDRQQAVVDQLIAHCAALQLSKQNAEVVLSTSKRWLAQQTAFPPFDLVFLDPPFEKNLITACCVALVEQQLLRPQARVYIETDKNMLLNLSPDWQVLRDKTAGQVRYQLLHYVA